MNKDKEQEIRDCYLEIYEEIVELLKKYNLYQAYINNKPHNELVFDNIHPDFYRIRQAVDNLKYQAIKQKLEDVISEISKAGCVISKTRKVYYEFGYNHAVQILNNHINAKNLPNSQK